MKSDVQFWTDVAVGQCIKHSVSPEQAAWYTLRCHIAQLMAYYRRDIPDEWEARIGEAIPTQLTYDIAGRMKGDVLFGVEIDLPDEEFQAVLKDPDHFQPPDFSPEAWRVISESTGMTREEWERLATDTREMLEKDVRCPNCNNSGKLREVAVLLSAPDPFVLQSGVQLHLKCRSCESDLTVDTSVKGLQLSDTKWPHFKNTLFWASVAAFVSTFVALLWALTRK